MISFIPEKTIQGYTAYINRIQFFQVKKKGAFTLSSRNNKRCSRLVT